MPKRTVLVVMEEGQQQSCLCFLLGVKGYLALPVTSAQEACERARAVWVDLAVIDLHVGDENGNVTAALLKRVSADIATLLISSTVRAGERDHIADCFLGKGTDNAQLVECVRTLLARKRGPKKQPAPAHPQRLAEAVTA